MIDLHANADQVVPRFSEHYFTPGCAQHGPEYPDTESPHHGWGLSVHCQSVRQVFALPLDESGACNACCAHLADHLDRKTHSNCKCCTGNDDGHAQ